MSSNIENLTASEEEESEKMKKELESNTWHNFNKLLYLMRHLSTMQNRHTSITLLFTY